MSLRGFIANGILMFVSVSITLLAIEMGFRIVGSREKTETLAALDQSVVVPSSGASVTLGQIIRLSTNPRIIYEFIPDLSVRFKGQPVSINDAGFRGDPIEGKKRPGEYRIVGIGDSVMFGYGVKDDESYLSVLSQKINADSEQVPWQVVNTAVPGYNTVMELEVLKEKGLSYEPDIVIVGYTWENDTSLPNFIVEPVDYFALDTSFLLEFIKNKGLLQNRMKEIPAEERRVRSFEAEPGRVPAQYRDMVGVHAVQRAMQELHELRSRHDFEVVIVGKSLPQWLKETVQPLGFHVLDTKPIWQLYARTHDIQDPDSAEILSKEDPHPSALAHRAIGIALAEYVQSNGLY
jgi:lysophospholipase L1-like esterase